MVTQFRYGTFVLWVVNKVFGIVAVGQIVIGGVEDVVVIGKLDINGCCWAIQLLLIVFVGMIVGDCWPNCKFREAGS